MERSSAEKFQPHMISSFSPAQLENVIQWTTDNNLLPSDIMEGNSLEEALLSSTLDEKGKPMNAKGRMRLLNGITAINEMVKESIRMSQIIGVVQIWQVGPEVNNIEMRWNLRKGIRPQG